MGLAASVARDAIVSWLPGCDRGLRVDAQSVVSEKSSTNRMIDAYVLNIVVLLLLSGGGWGFSRRGRRM